MDVVAVLKSYRGAEILSEHADELFTEAGHFELCPCGELWAHDGNAQFGPVAPGIAFVFSLIAAPVGSPAQVIVDFPRYSVLKKAVVTLGLLNGPRPVWWNDNELEVKVHSFEQLEKAILKTHRVDMKVPPRGPRPYPVWS